MIAAALLCVLGLPAGFMLIRRVPLCSRPAPVVEESFSLIIPARNEEMNLPRLLQSTADPTQAPVEIIVVNDGSADNTAAVANSFGARVLTSAEKPSGWVGKSWACYQGAQAAVGQLLVFLDADTYFLPGGLDRVISCWSSEQNPRAIISVLPYHAMVRAYEQLSLFFNILMAAGAGGFGAVAAPRLFGQCLLISKEEYSAAGGHAAVRGIVLENLRWADNLRARGCKLLCVGGQGSLHMRMFPDGLRQMSESWAKAFLQGAADSGRPVLFLSIAWISSLWSTAFLLIMPHDYGRISLSMVYILYGLQIAWIARHLGSYRLLTCLLFPLPLAYFCFVFGRAGVRRALGRKTLWRGREV
jgi:4,4'-diaponeurosporenoate glycosyltransferase